MDELIQRLATVTCEEVFTEEEGLIEVMGYIMADDKGQAYCPKINLN